MVYAQESMQPLNSNSCGAIGYSPKTKHVEFLPFPQTHLQRHPKGKFNRKLAYQDSVLLVSSVKNTLIYNEFGVFNKQCNWNVLRCPGLLTFTVEKNFKPKFEYFHKEMQGKLEELKEFPQYFAFSLEKRIKPRHMEAVKSVVTIPLPLMLKTTDEEFWDLIRQRD
ncbi:hypothetical protein RJ639_034358 [Escallonia herrerae]|uniref:Uncharacterized protein n=1 Tax=Escallonia herrerae TaxID=1293975 RepID=A0AA88WUF8_9ASTE|nr:hypothetical protein RJ639_034358 [Escallonia herrerae]